jgi:RNA polymerase sigma factor (sigma-70 family)
MDIDDLLLAELPAVLRFARVLTGDRATAEDVVQDVVERLLVRPERLASIVYPQAYLRRMVVNQYLSWGRKWFRIQPRPTAFDAAGSDVDPAEVVGDRDELRATLAGLPRNQRTVLVLRYYLSLGDDEIADTIGCSAGTVRTHASRALATLRSATPATEGDDRDLAHP